MKLNLSFLRPGEEVVMSGNANMQQFLGANKGGQLVLTNRRLVFVAHAFNVGSKFDEIPFEQIAMSGNTLNIFVPTPNIIKVETKNGKKYQFVVSGKQKEEWKRLINECVCNYSLSTPKQRENNKTINNDVVQDSNGSNANNGNSQINYPQQAGNSEIGNSTQSIQQFVENNGQKKAKSKKKKTIIGIVVGVVAIIVVVGSFSGESTNDKLSIVSDVDDSISGAEFDVSYDEAKKIIGRSLQVGDMNSDGGWTNQGKIQDSDTYCYEIISTSGIFHIQLGVNKATDNISSVSLYTELDLFDNDVNLNSFCSTLSEIMDNQVSESEIKNIATTLDDEGNSYYTENGVLYSLTEYEGSTGLSIVAVSDEYIDEVMSD